MIFCRTFRPLFRKFWKPKWTAIEETRSCAYNLASIFYKAGLVNGVTCLNGMSAVAAEVALEDPRAPQSVPRALCLCKD
jgi:hypothetical protein